MSFVGKEGPHNLTLEVGLDGGQAITTEVQRFMEDRGIRFVLAISGGADDDSPFLRHFLAKVSGVKADEAPKKSLIDLIESAKSDYVAGIIREILRPLRNYRIAILTGGTTWGVPRVANAVARDYGFPTIGVFPLKARDCKQVLAQNDPKKPGEQLDLALCVHPLIFKSQWGDESPIFAKMLDAAIVIGGNAGTMTEVTHLLKLNESSSAKKKHIIPIYGTGGTADKLSFFPGKPLIMAECIPPHPITSGRQAYDYLISNNILTEDIFEPQGEVT